MFSLKSTVLIPLYIKRKPLVGPVLFFVFSLLTLMLLPGMGSLFGGDETVLLILLVLDGLIVLPIFTISAIVLIVTALQKKNSVFRFIPEAPNEAVIKTNVLFDFESMPGQILYRNASPEMLDRTKPMMTLLEPDKVTGSNEGFFKVSNLTVNHNYQLVMFLASVVGIGPGGGYGVMGTGQFYWYIFIGEEYEKLMYAIREHNVNIPTSVQNNQEAKYIVEGIRARGN